MGGKSAKKERMIKRNKQETIHVLKKNIKTWKQMQSHLGEVNSVKMEANMKNISVV